MVERLKRSNRFGLILMKGGKEFPEHWKRHLEGLGYKVHKINESIKPLSPGELLNRWYPGVRRSLEDMVADMDKISKITGIPKEEINEIISLKDKTRFTNEEEERFKSFVEKLVKHKDKLLDEGIKSAHTLVASYIYLNRPVQWILLERKLDRGEIINKLGLDEEKVKELLKGRDYRAVPEQDFVKAVVVGATNMEKAHEGSLRNLAIKEINENGVKASLSLERNDFYPFIQNVVHCPWSEELDVDLGLLTEKEKERIIRSMKD